MGSIGADWCFALVQDFECAAALKDIFEDGGTPGCGGTASIASHVFQPDLSETDIFRYYALRMCV